jgi:hypothetical protein
MTYARSRLWLGVSAVGSLVVIVALALYFRLPYLLLPGEPRSWMVETAILAGLLSVYSVVHWPFDYVGGYHLPCHYGRQCQVLPVFVWTSFRATILQIALLTVFSMAVMHAGRNFGLVGALIMAGALMVGMLGLQLPIARAIGGLKDGSKSLEPVEEQLGKWTSSRPRAVVVESVDLGFSGGIAGLPGAETVVVPAHWIQQLSPSAVAVEVLRRDGIIRSGARLRGIIVALAWNLSGLALASRMPGAGFDSLAAFLTLGLWFNVWSFLGLLLLPSLSRPGVLEADFVARSLGVPDAILEKTAAAVDQLQDDEPSRGKWVERIFHPIPSVNSRKQAWRTGERPVGAWHAARLALYLSWPCLGLLGRAVHCNNGRPQLWVFLPAD